MECRRPIRIDHNSLANLLRSLDRTTFVGLFARTVPAMRKRENPLFGRVVKIAHIQACIGAVYASAVNRRRLKEGAERGLAEVQHFAAEPRKWGRRVRRQGTGGRSRESVTRCQPPLVEHAGRLYVHLLRQRVQQVQYRETETEREIPEDDVIPWLRIGDDSGRQGLRRPVIVRDYGLETIVQLRMRGHVYVIERGF